MCEGRSKSCLPEEYDTTQLIRWYLVTATNVLLLWPPCVADADIIFCPVSSFFLSFFPSPNLSDHTSTHGVTLVRI